MKEFDKNIEIDFLIKELISSNERIDNNMEIPNDYDEKRKLLRALMNTQTPVQLSNEFYEIQDRILSEETANKELVLDTDIESINQSKHRWNRLKNSIMARRHHLPSSRCNRKCCKQPNVRMLHTTPQLHRQSDPFSCRISVKNGLLWHHDKARPWRGKWKSENHICI